MYVFVKSYIQGCALCQQMKVNTHPSVSPLAPIKANPYIYPFSIVTMDFITDLPESNRYNILYVIVNHDLTKAIVLISYTKTINAIGTVRLYYNNVYQRFGLPNRIISDRESQFLSQIFQKMNK